jgi:hypothetical protein
VATAISALAEDRFAGIEVVDMLSATDTFPTHVLEEQSEPFSDGIAAFAEAVGGEAFLDRQGRILLRDVPDPGSTPVAWQMVEGDSCTVTSLSRTYSTSDGGVNAVVVTGESVTTTPVRAVAIDSDPESPTYYYGPYGPHPIWEQSSLITTTDQEQRAADARGRELFGVSEKVIVKAVPNPAIDEGDLLYVRRARTGFDDVMVVDSLSLPISYAGTMQMTCWVRRTVR